MSKWHSAVPDKSLVLDTNKWLVFKSDIPQNPAINSVTVKPTDDITGALQFADDRINLFDGTPTAHRYEYWVAWAYDPVPLNVKDISIMTDSANIATNRVQVYIDGVDVKPANFFRMNQYWNSIIIKMNTREMIGTLSIGGKSSILSPLSPTLFSGIVPLFTHYNFDYNNDGKLSKIEDIAAYTGTGTCSEKLNQNEVLMCILDFEYLTDALDPSDLTLCPTSSIFAVPLTC